MIDSRSPWIQTVPWAEADGTLKQAYDWQAASLGEPTEFTQLGSLYPDLVQLRLQLYKVVEATPSDLSPLERRIADNLVMHLQGTQTQRPMTYNFMAEVVRALGPRALEARITAADAKTIYANVTFEGLNGQQVVDARPSDALNLALRTGAPIRVASEALKDLQQVELGGEAPAVEWL